MTHETPGENLLTLKVINNFSASKYEQSIIKS